MKREEKTTKRHRQSYRLNWLYNDLLYYHFVIGEMDERSNSPTVEIKERRRERERKEQTVDNFFAS